jgi:hypothetical protein
MQNRPENNKYIASVSGSPIGDFVVQYYEESGNVTLSFIPDDELFSVMGADAMLRDGIVEGIKTIPTQYLPINKYIYEPYIWTIGDASLPLSPEDISTRKDIMKMCGCEPTFNVFGDEYAVNIGNPERILSYIFLKDGDTLCRPQKCNAENIYVDKDKYYYIVYNKALNAFFIN